MKSSISRSMLIALVMLVIVMQFNSGSDG
jgi:hypothetical protein